MNCPVCKAPVEGSPKFCPSCGSSSVADASSATAVAPATQADPRFDPFLGQMVAGRYKITKLLGEGGMGAVYLGEQNIGGTVRKVAIKTLHAHLSKDPKILQRFERECATVAGLQHPNTIQLYDFGKTDDGILYMVMEFVQGESLAAVLERNGSLEPPRTQHILQQICDALGEAHTMGIVHRDLKPENIVLTERAKDWVKVLDFGIAKRSEAQDKEEQRLTQQGTVLGTPPYMSPEQFTGKDIDARSDIYSIAVIAYEMLAGHLPFSAATPWEWATKHMTAAPQPLAVTPSGMQIPEPTVRAVMRGLAKDPADRFGTTREFFEALAVQFGGGDGLAISGGYAMAPASMVMGSLVPGGGGALSPTGPAPVAVGLPGSVAPPAMAAPVGAQPVETRGNTQIGEPTGTPGAPPAYGPGPGPAAYGPPGGPGALAATPYSSPPRRGRGGGGVIIAGVVIVGLLAAGGIVFALTRGAKPVAGRGRPATTATSPGQTSPTRDSDAGQGSTTNDTPTPGHLPPLIDTSLPSLPTNIGDLPGHASGHHADAGATPTPPASDPHSCKTARNLQTKISQANSPTPRMLKAFNMERAKCINEGGHL